MVEVLDEADGDLRLLARGYASAVPTTNGVYPGAAH
jgi:hypothetical protein